MDTDPKAMLAAAGEQLKLFLPAYTAGAAALVVELRALEVPQRYGKPACLTGYFDLLDPEKKAAFWAAVKSLVERDADQQPEGVYLTLNPVSPALLGRADHRLKPNGAKKISAADKDVTGRRFLLVDADPARPSGISSTDAEKALARHVTDGVRADLVARGWGEPAMFNDSGNGYHLWYPVDLPVEDGDRVEHVIKAIAARHNTPAVSIDTSVFNPSRIVKLPGTWARKGDSIPERPHRMARVLEVPQPCAESSPPT